MIGDVLWTPHPDARQRSRIGQFLTWVERRRGVAFAGYDDLWRWSVEDIEGFWAAAWEFLEVRASSPYTAVLTSQAMPGARWFPGARLNYAEQALQRRGSEVALIARSQTRSDIEMSWDTLHQRVARARTGLLRCGVGPGDRVAAYLPNIPETVVAFLATASLGAIWSSCPPEFGTQAVLDRFTQIRPSVLIAVDGYRYGSRVVDRRAEVEALRSQLPSLLATVWLPYLDAAAPAPPGALAWDELLDADGEMEFEMVAADHPLYVLYSSGTTGLPKAIVHGHGGILVEHLKTLALHADLGPSDRFSWFTTTGWMMWNFLVSGLTVGSAIVLFDGDPGWPDLDTLWGIAEETRTTWFGVSAPFLHACRASGIRPCADHDLAPLRAVGSTGSPLSPEGFRWVYEAVGRDLMLSSISGGTDICSAFIGGCPLVPVWEGEISCRYLGAAVAAFDPAGRPVVGRPGELVVTRPMPSMPVGLWGDETGQRLHQAYFAPYPGVWSHGDWIEITPRGSAIIGGRSDATLNRGGVRIGTAEIYRAVESVQGVRDSLVVHLDGGPGDAGRLVLFVAVETALDAELERTLRDTIRARLSPRHVPDVVLAVPSIPVTLSGKKLELPVKRLLSGAPPDGVVSRGSLRDPAALDSLLAIARSAGAAGPRGDVLPP